MNSIVRSLRQLRSTYDFVARHPLTRDHRLSAMGRVLRWQVKSRFAKGKTAVPFVGDTRLLIDRGMTGATGNLYVGLHEFRDMAFVLHLLRSGDDFFDVGANVGSYTVLAAGGAGARTMSFEPSPTTFAHLQDNIRLNSLESRATACCAAVGAEAGSVRFTTTNDTTNHVVAEGEAGVDVAIVTLDAARDGREPLAMKVDVEGFEEAVLRGATATLALPSLRAILIEANDSAARYGMPGGDVHATLINHGFALYDYDPFHRALTVRDHVGGETENGLYVRDPDFVRDRVKSAKPFRVLGRTI